MFQRLYEELSVEFGWFGKRECSCKNFIKSSCQKSSKVFRSLVPDWHAALSGGFEEDNELLTSQSSTLSSQPYSILPLWHTGGNLLRDSSTCDRLCQVKEWCDRGFFLKVCVMCCGPRVFIVIPSKPSLIYLQSASFSRMFPMFIRTNCALIVSLCIFPRPDRFYQRCVQCEPSN